MTQYKYNEIKSHFEDWIEDQDKQWITDNIDDLHHHCFNSDYYIIGTYRAKQWLGNQVFNIIDLIKRNREEEKRKKIKNIYTVIGFVGTILLLGTFIYL